MDINLPPEGVFHNLALVRIRKRYAGHAFKVMHALWGLGQMMFTKIIVVFDEEVDVQDLSEVLWRLGNHIDPERDVCFVRGPVDILDHASRLPGLSARRWGSMPRASGRRRASPGSGPMPSRCPRR